MLIKRVILGLILTLAYAHSWADQTSSDTTTKTTEAQASETTPPTPPAVTLPQDENEIDAAPDDNEFDSSEQKK